MPGGAAVSGTWNSCISGDWQQAEGVTLPLGGQWQRALVHRLEAMHGCRVTLSFWTGPTLSSAVPSRIYNSSAALKLCPGFAGEDAIKISPMGSRGAAEEFLPFTGSV